MIAITLAISCFVTVKLISTDCHHKSLQNNGERISIGGFIYWQYTDIVKFLDILKWTLAILLRTEQRTILIYFVTES